MTGRALTAVTLLVWGHSLFAAERPFDGAELFIEQHCVACHDSSEKSGNLDLESLEFQASDVDNFVRWIKVFDRVSAGEMPPESETRPDEEVLSAFTTQLSNVLSESEQRRYAREGRAGLRRLNRYEYENAIRDLLNVPWAQIKDKLPEDGEAYRFNKTGHALDVSHVQMARYMSSAEHAMLEAVRAVWNRPEAATRKFYARDEFSLIGSFRPRENSTLPDRHSFPVLDSHAQPDVRAGRKPVSSPETREREAVGKVSSIFSDAGGYSWSQFRLRLLGITD
jgi:hypothetical protein